ncbi:MAG: DNA-directed RNA polymerase subunit beta', partial [Patescibacteria group bacterium]
MEKLIPATLNKNGSVYDMVYSGARGSMSQITQMAGMKGLITNTAGDTIEFPIISCSKEGLTPIEYFITTHGSRKGLTDTALNTAKAGYLTRRLFDVAQDMIVSEEDCATKEGMTIRRDNNTGVVIPMSRNLKGRFLLADVSTKSGEVLFKKGHFLNKYDAQKIEQSDVEEVVVRSPLGCKSLRGICVKCYGVDLGKNKVVDLGEAVGTIAAQAIGEPGTQLTMRTFHAGGTASVGGDITQGLPRVEEVFEKRKPKNPAIVNHVDGTVTDIKLTGKEKIIVVLPEIGDKAKTKTKASEVEYIVNQMRTILVKVGDTVKKGDIITDGSADIDEMFKFAGQTKTEQYIIKEISKLYELQGEAVSRKHIELIVRQMFSRRKVKETGQTNFSRGDIVENSELMKENARVKDLKMEEAVAEQVVMGITEVSLSRKSFLSAASFQHTTRVLINSAIR